MPGRAAAIWRVVAIVSATLALTLAVWLLGAPREPVAPPLVGSRAVVTQLTNYGGFESDGAIAPDGGSFVYVSMIDGQADIFRRQAEGGDPVRLTSDAAAESHLMFAPSGETIYFTRESEGRSAVWRIGALGGNPRKVVDNARAPAISGDGRQLAWLADPSPNDFGVGITLDRWRCRRRESAQPGSERRSATAGTAGMVPRRTFSRVLAGGSFLPRNLFVVNMADGTVRQVTHFENSGEGTLTQAWLPDGRHLLVSYWAKSRAQLVNDLGILDVETGEIARLTMNVVENFNGPSLSADGTRGIATVSRLERELWKVPDGPDPIANGSGPSGSSTSASIPCGRMSRVTAARCFTTTRSSAAGISGCRRSIGPSRRGRSRP